MGDLRCFICRTTAADIDGGRSSRIEKTKLGDEIEVIFIITKLMEIPSHVCTKFLSSNGNPSRWIFYCQECAVIIRKSRKTYEKMITLQNAFSLLKTQLRNYIKVAHEGSELPNEKYLDSKSRQDIPDYLLSLYLSQNEMECSFRDVSQDDFVKIEVEEDVSDVDVQEDDEEIITDIFENEIQNNIDLNSDSDNVINYFKDVHSTADVNMEENEDNFPADDSRFTCEYCQKGFNYKHSMEYHIRKFHTKETSHACEKCGDKFVGGREVRIHIAEAHPEEKQELKGKHLKHNVKGPKVIVCETCGRNCKGDSTYKTHMLCHTGEKPFLCELCSQSFFSVTLLTWHKRYSHYKELGLEPFKCDECGKCLRSPKALRYHTAHHAQRKDFICHICGNEYVDKYKLSDHIKIHHEKQKLFECKECGEKLFRKRHVEEHRQRHSGKYDYNCDICQKGFIEKFTFKKHMKYHSAEFPHKRKSRLTKKIV